MFLDKNKTQKLVDLSQHKEIKPEDVPIHTMHEDLESLEHPEKKAQESILERAPLPPKPGVLPDIQRGSPFLSENVASDPSSAIGSDVSNPLNPESQQQKEAKITSFFSSAKPKIDIAAPPQISKDKPMEDIQSAPVSAQVETPKLPNTGSIYPQSMDLGVFPQPNPRIQINDEDGNTGSPSFESEPLLNRDQYVVENLDNKQSVVLGAKKILAAIVIILIVIILGGGGYYFWMTRQNKQVESTLPTQPEQPAPPVEFPNQPEPVPPVTVSKFNLDKPNYLQTDVSNNSTDEVSNSILRNIQDAKNENITGLLEFIVTDKNNNPITFQIFAEKIGITFSKNILEALEETFYFFIYNDAGNYRIGLTIDYDETKDMKKLMQSEETNLIPELKALFLSVPYTLPKSLSFSSTTYKDIPIRYLNISSPRELSLDYALTANKLVIGTTMLTNRSIIDHLSK